MTTDDAGKERLQKILARAGYGSRRACEELIVEGRVTINNMAVSVLGVRADPFRDTVAVDGEKVHLPKPAYWLLNKQEGTSFNDAEAEAALQDIVKGEYGRLFTAGRLDRNARGLMLITNDGRIANLLTHPRYRVPKVYRISVRGNVEPTAARNIERALFYAMNSGRFQPLEIGKRVAGKSQLELVVYEGLHQTLRDICLKFGHGVKTIERVRLGPIEMGHMAGGELRKLRGDEIRDLLHYADEAEAGRLNYEKDLVNPARFQRDDDATGFRRKKTGTRGTTTEGQKKTSARVRAGGSSGGRGKPRSDSRGGRPGGPRRDRDDSRGERTGGPRGDKRGGPRRDREDSRGGPRGDKRSGPRRDRADSPRGDRGAPRGERSSERSGPRRDREDSRGGRGGPRSSSPRGDRPSGPRRDRTDSPRGDRRDGPRSDKRSAPRSDRPGKPRGDKRSAPSGDKRRSGPRTGRPSGPGDKRGKRPGKGKD